MKTIVFQKEVSVNAKESAVKILLDERLSYNKYKLEYVEKDGMDCYDWDENDKKFIDEHPGFDFYILYDCKVWNSGQELCLVAVDY